MTTDRALLSPDTADVADAIRFRFLLRHAPHVIFGVAWKYREACTFDGTDAREVVDLALVGNAARGRGVMS